jgi:hypothetical protein
MAITPRATGEAPDLAQDQGATAAPGRARHANVNHER